MPLEALNDSGNGSVSKEFVRGILSLPKEALRESGYTIMQSYGLEKDQATANATISPWPACPVWNFGRFLLALGNTDSLDLNEEWVFLSVRQKLLDIQRSTYKKVILDISGAKGQSLVTLE